MPLKTFKTKDEIPAEQAANALALADGSFAVFEEADVTDMQTQLTDARRKLEAADKATRKAAAEALAARNAAAAAAEGVDGEKLAKIRADALAEWQATNAGKLEAAEKALKENRELKLDTKVKQIAAAKGVTGSELNAWFKLHGDKFDLLDDGTIVVKGKEGTTLDKFIEVDCKKETPYLYEGTKGAGGGAGGGGSPPPTGTISFDDLMANPQAALTQGRTKVA